MRKIEFLHAVKQKVATNACQELYRQYRAQRQRSCRRFTQARKADFLKKLHKKDPSVHALVKKPVDRDTTPISDTAWQDHLNAVFRQRTTTQTGSLAGQHFDIPLRHVHTNTSTQPEFFQLPTESCLRDIVAMHVSRINPTSSSGFDTILPVFLKHACKPRSREEGSGSQQHNVMTPVISKLFYLLLRQASIPAEWKSAKITPLHKKGSIIHACNYRMLAVSGTFYRLYANVLRTLLQDWCHHHHKIPDSQFGFYPGRSTLHPLFILRHLKHAAQTHKPRGSPRLYAAFIDFQQAYDSIPRDQLWRHLQQCQLPQHFLNVLKNLYHDDEYILIDGDKQARVKPTFGVKQGCPLSPLLFSLYLNDIHDVVADIDGACTGTHNFTVTHLLYADDLCLTSNSAANLQSMLNRLRAYSCRKCLTVNSQKSVIVCFNSRTDNFPPFFYGNDILPMSDYFKYLGMLLDRSLNLHNAAEEALKPCLAGMARIRSFAHNHQIHNRLHAYIWLFKTYVVPAGMYASQLWATPYLQQGTEMQNCIQKWLLRFLRSILGVRTSTPSWSVLRECGMEPIQFNWFRACARLYNSLTHCNSPLLHKVFCADISLSHRNPSCWTSHLLLATNGLLHAHKFQHCIRTANPLDLSQLVVDLRTRHLAYWRLFSSYHPRDINSRRMTYHRWSALPTRNAHVTYSPYVLPKYFYLDLPKHIVRSVARFRLRVHTLNIERATWDHSIPPSCNLCDAQDEVQDEQHAIFKCTHPGMCNLRLKYASLFSGPLLPLAHPTSRMAPYLPASHHVQSYDMFGFLNQDNNRLYPFLHELLNFFEQASSQSF